MHSIALILKHIVSSNHGYPEPHELVQIINMNLHIVNSITYRIVKNTDTSEPHETVNTAKVIAKRSFILYISYLKITYTSESHKLVQISNRNYTTLLLHV